MKEPMRREIYQTKCMRYLTVLDYSALESKGRNVEAKLEEKEDEINKLRQELKSYTSRMDYVEQMLNKISQTKESIDRLIGSEVTH